MNGELGLDLKTIRKDGERLHKGARKGAIPRHDVFEPVPIDGLDHKAHEIVAKAMEGALVLLGIAAVGEPVAHRHVRLALNDRLAEPPGRLGGIGVVAIDHKIAVRFDIAEHLTDHIAFALAGLTPNDCAMGARDLGGIIGRVVVVDIDRCLRQLAMEASL